ncbi:MAG: hypothetical protein AB3K77_01140 [Methanosarcinaceae archaeon]|nr:hypothetical protein [Methanosarcina sp. MTP4]
MVPGNLILIYTAALSLAFGNGIMWPCVISILWNTGRNMTLAKIREKR